MPIRIVRANIFLLPEDPGIAPDPDEITEGISKQWSGQRNDSLTIPAGAYQIEIQNVDPSKSLSVDGNPIAYGEQVPRNVFFDRVNNVQDLAGAVVIDNPTGAVYWIRVAYPSSSTVDVAAIF